MDLFIIAGPNGVGKTTFAREFLPNYADCKNFVNADLIAQGMAPFSPETAAFRAGRMMLSEIQSFAKRRLPFAFETTLSGRSYMGLLRRLKAQGYRSQARGDQGYSRNFASWVRFAIFIFPRTETSPGERNAERTLSSRQNFGSILGLLHCSARV